MKYLSLCLITILLSVACTNDNVHVTVSSESSSTYEKNESHSYKETVNGKVVKEIESKTTSSGGSESDFNLVIGNGDTTITKDEMPDLNPKITCTQRLSDEDCERLKATITKAFLDKNRILTAKVAINDWCLTSSQVRDVLALFTMDKYRLDFAKFAYGHVTDRVNYGRVKDAFSFEKTKVLLDNYINTL